MWQPTTDPKRRRAITFIAASVVAIPLAKLVSHGTAVAGELPHLSEDDPTAKA